MARDPHTTEQSAVNFGCFLNLQWDLYNKNHFAVENIKEKLPSWSKNAPFWNIPSVQTVGTSLGQLWAPRSWAEYFTPTWKPVPRVLKIEFP